MPDDLGEEVFRVDPPFVQPNRGLALYQGESLSNIDRRADTELQIVDRDRVGPQSVAELHL